LVAWAGFITPNKATAAKEMLNSNRFMVLLSLCVYLERFHVKLLHGGCESLAQSQPAVRIGH
jgi:hypothetical protein